MVLPVNAFSSQWFQTWPNQALQRTRSAVTAAASGLRFAATMQPPRQLPRVAELGVVSRRSRPVRTKAKEQRIPDAIAPWQVVVSRMPLDHLFTEAGRTAHVRGKFLTPAAVESLLRASRDYRLVEAQMGTQLRWYPRGDYGFWYHRARPHAADPNKRISLDDFPDAMFYFVSEWHDSASGERVLLYEEHH